MSTKRPIHLVLLNELTIWRVVWLAVTGRRVCCIQIAPVFGPSFRLFSSVVGWLAKHFAVRDVLDFDPRLEKYKEVRLPRHHEDPFRLAEPWLDQYLGHDHLDASLQDDAMPLRQAACTVFSHYIDAIWFIRWFSLHYRRDEAVIIGLDPFLSGSYRAIYGEEPALPCVRYERPRRWSNNLLTVAAMAASVLQALRSVRLSPTSPRHIFLGSDYSGHPRDVSVWKEIAAERHEVLVVFRTAVQRKAEIRGASGFASAVPGEGQWSVARAWTECGEAWMRWRRIRRVALGLSPALAFQACLLPLRRIKMRQLFTRYRFVNFWVRDDYGVEHIIRSQELRRFGGKSIGVAHAFPISCALLSIWRYIDCDAYLVQGLGILRHYGDRWAPWMKVIASGSLGLTRDLEARLAAPRPNNIIFQPKPKEEGEPLMDLLASLASSFPDRQIFVQFKLFFRNSYLTEHFRQIARQYPNVVETDESIYKLFLRARYLVTDPSTIAAEALQFGLYAFVLDYDGRKSLYFRDYPGLCLQTPKEVVHRIKGIEDGSYIYRLSDYDSLINRKGHFLNQFREELGLAPILARVSADLLLQPCAD